jgi:hypothetical protein
MQKVLSLICFTILSTFIFSQSDPEIFCSLEIGDTVQSRTIYFGVDPNASDSIDFNLGEANLPPFPPPPALEVRFNLPESAFSGVKSSYRDFRNGTTPFSGQVEHRLKYQKGPGGSLTINYSLPQEILIHIEDIFGGILINTDISGAGALNIPDALDQLKLIVNYNNATDVNYEQLHPVDFNLSQNFPNPFNPSTKIRYSIPDNQFVSLKVFDILGKELTTLINEEVSAGNHEVIFSGDGFTSGIYFYKLMVGKVSQTKSMILMK